jgi:hypothetical protein
MTEQERQQHVDDLTALVNQMEFKVHISDSIVARVRREYWLTNIIFWLSGALAGGLTMDWWWQ